MNPDLTSNFSIQDFLTVLSSAFDPSSPVNKSAQQILTAFKDDPKSIFHVNTILTQTSDPNAHFIAVQILENTVKTRWNLLTEPEKSNLRTFVINNIIANKKRFNAILVEILKRDWPKKWPSFVSDIIGASQSSSMDACANFLLILKRLFEEMAELQSYKRRVMERQFRAEIVNIFNFFVNILVYSRSSNVTDALMENLFSAFETFSGIVPLRCFCEGEVVESICFYFNSKYSLNAIKCVVKIATLLSSSVNNIDGVNNISSGSNISISSNINDTGEREQFERKMLVAHREFIKFLDLYFSKFKDTKIQNVYHAMDMAEKEFLINAVTLLGTFYSKMELFENNDFDALKKGIYFLLKMSKINDEKLFKETLLFWREFSKSLYIVSCGVSRKGKKEDDPLQPNNLQSNNISNNSEYFYNNNVTNINSKTRYEAMMHALIDILISKMPRPEEVFVTENEFGEVVKEKMTESDQIEFYKNTKETFYYLSFINKSYTFQTINEKVKKLFVNDFSYEKINRISWSAGCIANVFEKSEEDTLFVGILKELLSLCEVKYKKSDKAIIASNILFLIGQFNKFLMHNTNFLKTVIKKLFEFMKEDHEGIKEMASDTLLKISRKCGKIIAAQMEGNDNYLVYQLKILRENTELLEFYQRRIVYEAFCLIIACVSDNNLMHDNQGRGSQKQRCVKMLTDCFVTDLFAFEGNLKGVCHCLRSYGLVFEMLPEAVIYSYEFLNTLIVLHSTLHTGSSLSRSVQNNISTQNNGVESNNVSEKTRRIVRGEIIRVLITVMKNIDINFVKIIFEKILPEYKNTKDSAYLELTTEIVKTVKVNLIQRDTFILNNILGVEAEMNNSYFVLLLTLFDTSFESFFPILSADPLVFKKTYERVLAGLEDNLTNETCIEILATLFKKSLACNNFVFFQNYTLVSIENILGIIFDKDKSFSFEKQCGFLSLIIKIMLSGNMINLSSEGNAVYLKKYMESLLVNFKNLTRENIEVFMMGVFGLFEDEAVFMQHVEDFRGRVYEFGGNEDVQDEVNLVNERILYVRGRSGN